MQAAQYTADNDNHEQRYATFTNRLGKFMRGERTVPASMSDEEWTQLRRVSEGRELYREALSASRLVHGTSLSNSVLRSTKKASRHAA